MDTDASPWQQKVPAAQKWFWQAKLVDEKTKKTTRLLEVFEKNGIKDPLGWDLIWLTLANNADIVKWFVTATEIGRAYEASPQNQTLPEMLRASDPRLNDSAILGGLTAFKDMLKNSPFGEDGGVAYLEFEKSKLVRITRQAKSISPLVALYGLYLAAELTERSAFTVREMLTAELNSAFVSPLVAFGVDPEEFKKICEGLRSRYPDFVSTVFTHGNDQVEIYPRRFGTDDVLALVLEN